MTSSWGAIGDEFIACCSQHYRAFWKLREWAVEEQIQMFQLTEKAFRSLDSGILKFWERRRFLSSIGILSFLDS